MQAFRLPPQICRCSADGAARATRTSRGWCDSVDAFHGSFCRCIQFSPHSCFLLSAKKAMQRENIDTLAQSARPVPIRLLAVGKSRNPGVQSVTEYYAEKIRRYCSFEEIQVRSNPKSTSDVNAQVEAESNYVMRNISSKDWVILLDEKGDNVTSENFALMIADAGDMGFTRLVFCIGGPYGHGAKVRQRANVNLRLSSMVLNHQVALVVLLEQIYRAWTILRGEKYHH